MVTLALVSFGVSLAGKEQGSTHPSDPCDKRVNFCWYGPYQHGSDEVQAWGNRWIPQEKSEKAMEISTAIRCVKRMNVCMYAGYQVMLGSRRINRVQLLPINRGDRSVTLISSPGPRAETSACTGLLGSPKTVIYKLQSE
jgi:hypothetical protein